MTKPAFLSGSRSEFFLPISDDIFIVCYHDQTSFAIYLHIAPSIYAVKMKYVHSILVWFLWRKSNRSWVYVIQT